MEAGLYVTAGTKIEVWDKEKAAAGVALDVVKGADLSGKNNILFIRNSLTGASRHVRARPASRSTTHFTRTDGKSPFPSRNRFSRNGGISRTLRIHPG